MCWGPSKIVYNELVLVSPTVFRIFYVRLTWTVFEMGDKWPHSCCFMGCCFQVLLNIASSLLVQFPSSFFSIHFVSIHVGHPYSSIVTTAIWKKSCFILADRSDFYMIDNPSIAIHTFARCILASFLLNETLLPRYVNLFTILKYSSLREEMAPHHCEKRHRSLLFHNKLSLLKILFQYRSLNCTNKKV